MGYFPVMLDLKAKPVLLIGGGAETGLKARQLLEAGARLTLLMPPGPEGLFGLEGLVQEGRIHHLPRPYRYGDLEGYWLVVSHPKDKGLNALVQKEAQEKRVFLIAVDDPKRASAILPAVLRRGELILALSTSGAAPALAVRLKERLAHLLGPDWGEMVAFLRTLRPTIARLPSFEARKALWYQVVDQALEALETGDLERAKRTAQGVVEQTLLAQEV